MWRGALLSALALAVASQAASGQVIPYHDRSIPWADSVAPVPSPGRAFLYSALLPGLGQQRVGLERWVPYVAFEFWGLARYFDRRSRGRQFERDYRDLAWAVARRGTATNRIDGEFWYYEAIGQYAASGAFDVAPDRPGIQPESRADTYNGSIWALARDLHFPGGDEEPPEDSPEYQLALDYYREHAVGPAFAWSWGENHIDRETYRRRMRDSDEALRSATRTLGLILANHLVSAADALVAARLHGPRSAEPPFKLESTMEVRGGRTTWDAVVRIPWPRR